MTFDDRRTIEPTRTGPRSGLAIRTALVAAALVLAPAASQAQVAVTVSPAQLATLQTGCTGGSSCQAALDALIAAAAAANPGSDLATLIGSIVAAIASAYNAGTFPAAAALAALDAAAGAATAAGLAELAGGIQLAAASVSAGDPIYSTAVASGDGSASPG